MSAQSLPDLEAAISPEQMHEMMREAAIHLCNAKKAWRDKQFRKFLPPRLFTVYLLADDQGSSDAERNKRWEQVNDWMKKHDWNYEEEGTNARILHGRKHFSTFYVRLVNE